MSKHLQLMQSRELLNRVSPVLFVGLEEWDRTAKKRLEMAQGLVRGGDIGGLRIHQDESSDGRFIGLTIRLLVHSKVTGSDWYRVEGVFRENVLWQNADLSCTCNERQSVKVCSHTLALLLCISIGQFLEGLVDETVWCKPVRAHLPMKFASKRLQKRPELRELYWETPSELWTIITGSLDSRTHPAETQHYHLGWTPAVPRGRGCPRGRVARAIVSTSFGVASGSQPFRPRRGRGRGGTIAASTTTSASLSDLNQSTFIEANENNPSPVTSIQEALSSSVTNTQEEFHELSSNQPEEFPTLFQESQNDQTNVEEEAQSLARDESEEINQVDQANSLFVDHEQVHSPIAPQTQFTATSSHWNRGSSKRQSRSSLLTEAMMQAIANPFSPRSTRRRLQ